MRLPRKSFIIPGILSLIYLYYRFHYGSAITSLHSHSHSNTITTTQQHHFDATLFHPGTRKPPGSNYSIVLVMGYTASEDISWIARDLPHIPTALYPMDEPDSNLSTTNNNDNPNDTSNLKLTVPANKGHESMAYLTYIITHYPSFPDVVLFFHPHRTAWHNNIMHDISTPVTINRLRPQHVVEQGYFNSRCHLDPGCPKWLKVDRSWWWYDHVKKPEEPHLTTELFKELHGEGVQVPSGFISQPCCAQFAVSGERLRERPRAFYERYRDWLLETELDDATAGRLLEYGWQYIFTGQWEYCPMISECYCRGYGVCFGEGPDEGEERLWEWLRILKRKERVDEKRVEMWRKGRQGEERYGTLTEESEGYKRDLERRREEAIERGKRVWGGG